MKKFNLLVTAAATMLATTVFAQNTTDKWYFGIGVQATDHTSVRGIFDGYFDTDDWSLGFPKITVARSIAKNLAVDLQISGGNQDNRRLQIRDEFFFLAGLGLRYSPLSESTTAKWLDPYVRVGANYHRYDYEGIEIDQNNPYTAYDNGYNPDKNYQLGGKFSGKEDMFVVNGGVGINFWITNKFGINIESQYNWVTNQSKDYSDFFQHSAAFIFKFGSKKDKDSDGDGILDKDDACPFEPGPIENNGCPWGDRDGDGIPDKEDRCPDTPGLPQFQGCPDTDGDGIPDPDDRCPNEAGPAKFQGCPDTDGDGIPDIDDKCPNEYGPKENQGCPWDVQTVTERIRNINFKFNSSQLTDESLPLIKQASNMLNDKSFEGKKFYVDGHTDRVGTDAVNNRISKQRAQSVVNQLVKDGVDKDRLIARGFGKTQLLCKQADINTTKDSKGNILWANQAECDKANRRVVILDQSGEKPVLKEEVKK